MFANMWPNMSKWGSLRRYETSGSGTTSLAWTYIKVCGYSDSFCKNLNQRSLTPRWHLTPHLLRFYVWLYPRIIVSKSHENTSKYVDRVTFFAKTWSEGHWPLDDLWPHICWGHMCDSSQGSLCPSSMGIHQCMWIQWSILQKHIHTHTTYTYYIHILHTTYYVQNQWSHSLFLNYVQARQKRFSSHNNVDYFKHIKIQY